MIDIINSISKTPVPISLIILGVIFLFLAIGGKLGAQIITDNIKKPVAAWLGGTLLVAGIVLHFIPQVIGTKSITSQEKQPSSKAYHLRTKSDEVGPTIKAVQQIDIPNGRIKVNAGNKFADGTFAMSIKIITATEVLKKSNGRPIAIREQVISHEVSTETKVNGKITRSKDHGPLHGQTLLIEWGDGKWKKSLLGKQPTSIQLQELNKPYIEEQGGYPDKPLQIGDAWELDGSQIALFSGLANARSVNGHAYMRLDEIKEYKREQCASISTRCEIKTTMDLNGQEIRVELGGYGSSLRSLHNYYDLKNQFSGEMKMNGEVQSKDGKTGSFTIIGPFQMEVIKEPI